MHLGLKVKDRVLDAFKPGTTWESQNVWNLYADIAWFGVLSGIANSFLGGVFNAGFALASFNNLLEVCPEQNRASFIAAFSTLINIAVFISPILSTSLTAFLDIRALLMVSASMRLLGSALFWQQGVAQPKPAR